MRIRNFENLMKYLGKYKNNPKKISKIKENFTQYLSLCSQENVMFFIEEIKNISEMEGTLYYHSDFIYKNLE